MDTPTTTKYTYFIRAEQTYTIEGWLPWREEFKVCAGLGGSMGSRASWQLTHGQRSRESEVSRYRHGCDPPEPADTALDCNTGFSLQLRRACECSQPTHRTNGDTHCRQSLNTCQWRLLILAWLIAWLTVVPLFHIHIPDSTDRWSVLQSGGAHTVFTPDLPGEFSRPFSDSSRSLAKRGVNSPELGIALLVEKSKATELTILRTPSHVLNSPLLPSLVLEAPEQHRTLRLSQAVLAPRAPPRIVSVEIFPVTAASYTA